MSLTRRETKQIKKGVCPDCKSKEWYAGPRGGECQNIECAGCGSRFNVGPNYAERIPKEEVTS